jgi:hypothetical protein
MEEGVNVLSPLLAPHHAKDEIPRHIYDFYQNLMGVEDIYPLSLVHNIWPEG